MGTLAYNTRNIPQLGKWVGRVSHVADILSTPCAVDPQIAVLAFWNATPHLLWSLFKPDTNDLVTKRWGGGHKKKRNKNWHTIEDIIADEPLPKGLGVATFKLGQDAAQRIGWYLMVADATTDFAVHWTSTAYQWSGCRTPGAPFCQSVGPPGPYGSETGGTFLLGAWQVQNELVFAGDGTHIATPGGYNASASVSVVLADPGYPYRHVEGFSARLIDQVTGNTLDERSNSTDFEGTHWTRLYFRAWETLALPHSFAVEVTCGGGYYNWERSSFQAYGNKDGGMLSDP